MSSTYLKQLAVLAATMGSGGSIQVPLTKGLMPRLLGPVPSCSDQAGCLTITTSPVCSQCGTTGSSCSFQVCTTVDTSLGTCDKNGDSISHWCYGDTTDCPAGFPTNKEEPVRVSTECQTAAPGEVVHFIVKDGNGACGSLSTFGSGGETIKCGANPGWTNNNLKGCSGGGNLDKECLWNVTVPFDCSACESEVPTETPTPQPTGGDCGTCIIFGDPHITTFKTRAEQARRHEEFMPVQVWAADQLTVREAGTFYLVKNEELSIQAMYEQSEGGDGTFMKAIAIGGACLQGHVLVIRTLDGKITWSEQEILQALNSTFDHELFRAHYHSETRRVVLQADRAPTTVGIDLELPHGVILTINRWPHSLAAEINMCPTEGQVGQCGSFADDSF